VEIEKLREQLGQYEELRSREGSPAVRFKEPLYDNYVPPGVAVRQKSDRTKKPAQPSILSTSVLSLRALVLSLDCRESTGNPTG
jgi:hypothetical protein